MDEKQQAAWFADRVEESRSGRLLFATHVLNKYRKMTLDYQSPNAVIRADIIKFCVKNGFAM
jgi:hypothetical protein